MRMRTRVPSSSVSVMIVGERRPTPTMRPPVVGREIPTGDFGDAKFIRKFGDVSDDLSAL